MVEAKLQVENWHRGWGREKEGEKDGNRSGCVVIVDATGMGSKKENVRVRQRSAKKVLTRPGEVAVCGS